MNGLQNFYKDTESINDAYTSFISLQEWDYFLTITFKQHWMDSGHHSSIRQGRKDSIYNAQQVWDFLHRHQSEKAFLACEAHRFGGIHYHGLIKQRPPELYLDIPGEYETHYNEKQIELEASACFGYSRVEPIRSLQEVSGYCSKYVTKGSPDNFFLFGQWQNL